MRIFSILIMCGLLSACTIDSVQRQPQVQVEAVTHKMALQLDSKELTKSDKEALNAFIYQRGELSALRISIDSYSDKGTKTVPALIALLKEAGVYPSQVTSRFKTSTSTADIVLVVESYRSLVPDCQAGKMGHMVLNGFNSSPNFGCANASALAQMIADPRDLVVGEQLGAMEGRKAIATLDAYYNQPTQQLNQSSPISGSLSGSQGQ